MCRPVFQWRYHVGWGKAAVLRVVFTGTVWHRSEQVTFHFAKRGILLYVFWPVNVSLSLFPCRLLSESRPGVSIVYSFEIKLCSSVEFTTNVSNQSLTSAKRKHKNSEHSLLHVPTVETLKKTWMTCLYLYFSQRVSCDVTGRARVEMGTAQWAPSTKRHKNVCPSKEITEEWHICNNNSHNVQ